MKTKVLFILPSKGTGGIISSFIPLYNSIKEKIEVKILFLSPEDKADISFDDSVIKDTLLSLYYQNYSSLGFFQKVCAIYLKLIKRKNQANGNDMSFWVGKCVAKRLMRQYQFDMVVGFSEGAPTKLAACFIGAKKVSWIHCDYKRGGREPAVCQRPVPPVGAGLPGDQHPGAGHWGGAAAGGRGRAGAALQQ